MTRDTLLLSSNIVLDLHYESQKVAFFIHRQVIKIGNNLTTQKVKYLLSRRITLRETIQCFKKHTVASWLLNNIVYVHGDYLLGNLNELRTLKMLSIKFDNFGRLIGSKAHKVF